MRLRGQKLIKNKNSDAKAWVTPEREPDRLRLVLGGEWVTMEIARLESALNAARSRANQQPSNDRNIKR